MSKNSNRSAVRISVIGIGLLFSALLTIYSQAPAPIYNISSSMIAMNFGTAYSETQARVAVLGQSARDPTPDEIARMGALVETAMGIKASRSALSRICR